MEYRISLDSINTIDTSWWSYYFPQSGFRRPHPGDTTGFNVAVGDDDNGGDSYVRSEPGPHSDSYTAWDGRSVGWFVAAEQDWEIFTSRRIDAEPTGQSAICDMAGSGARLKN